jgi:hypothetical protein
MFVKDYEWYLRHLTEHVRLKPSDIEFVDNIASWCREHGVEESDEKKPLKLVHGNGDGIKMLIAREIPEEVLEERINALRIRSQLKSLTYDRADLLNSATKKIAFLFLKEFSMSDPDLAFDDLAADEWVFGQMDRIGMFNP